MSRGTLHHRWAECASAECAAGPRLAAAARGAGGLARSLAAAGALPFLILALLLFLLLLLLPATSRRLEAQQAAAAPAATDPQAPAPPGTGREAPASPATGPEAPAPPAASPEASAAQAPGSPPQEQPKHQPETAPPQRQDGSYLPDAKAPASDPLGSRLINVATPVTAGARGLELLITHRFRLPVQQGTSGNLYGIDSGADVGIGLSAGIGRNLDFSAYRSAFEDDFELAGKLVVLRQGSRMPLSLAVRGGVDLPGQEGVLPHTRPLAQLLLSARLAPGLNVLVSPSWVSATPTIHNAYNIPVGITFPFPGRAMVELEVIPPNSSVRRSQTAWHAALSKAVGWHIFKLVAGNSRATTVDQMLGGDSDSGFKNRDVRLGFNLIRFFAY